MSFVFSWEFGMSAGKTLKQLLNCLQSCLNYNIIKSQSNKHTETDQLSGISALLGYDVDNRLK